MTENTKFAKLFDTALGQVLVTHEDSYEDNEGQTLYPLSIRIEAYKGLDVKVNPGYESFAIAQDTFAAFGQQKAEEAAVQLRFMVDQLSTEKEKG